jgi:hypothetical protein
MANLAVKSPLRNGRSIPLPVKMVPVWSETSGAAAGMPQSAADGLQTTQDSAGNVWAWNTAVSPAQWMQVYTIPGTGLPQGLYGLASQVYGSGAQWTAIYNVPQNKAIQGTDPDTGLIPGDTILLPNLSQPSGPPSAPSPGIAPQNPVVAPPVIITPGGGTTPSAPIIPASTTTTTTTTQQKFWTPGKMAVAGVLGVGGVGLIVYLATRKKRRRAA